MITLEKTSSELRLQVKGEFEKSSPSRVVIDFALVI